ncbi:MAG: HDIG domain-containing protein [Bdellovibrionales bacterium]|nr:HDIG domain-containing protein [Bdellovibrionales bacterium]
MSSPILFEEEAKRLLAIAISRQAKDFSIAGAVTRVRLSPSQLDQGFKARIVGKEGRNARVFEEKAGVDLLLNDEPDSVLISSFDPYRREVARVALEALILDGRIQPVKIEECLADARLRVDEKTRENGAAAAKASGVEGLHPAILRLLGTLAYRHSFGQNQLEHSVESARFCATLASELGFDPKIAARAALLHDLGKALDSDHVGSHAAAGAEFAKRFGESEVICQAIAAHHEESSPKSWLDHLVIAADALSGARPGARKGSTQNVLDRSVAMERIAKEIPGVTEAYAVQAGRSLRVFVDTASISDEQMKPLADQIARKIESDLRFPGELNVSVIREMRVSETARLS